MKHLLAFLILVNCGINSLHAQEYFELDVRGFALKKLNKGMDEGDAFDGLIFTLQSENIENVLSPAILAIKKDGSEVEIGRKQKVIDDLEFESNVDDYWRVVSIKNGVYMNLLEQGYQYGLRNDLEEESLEYLNFLAKEGLVLEDAVIKDYLQSLFLKVLPNPLGDGRIGQIDIRILKISEPYAAILANGTALISIGMMNLVNTEEELLAVIAHEAAHFVLDHSVENINHELERQKRAEFWAGLATVAAAATSVYASAKYDVYVDPSLVVGTALVAYSITANINERIGRKFSREQELLADKCSTEILELLGYDSRTLGTVLAKLREYFFRTGNNKVFANDGTHPNINFRIEKIGLPDFYDPDQEYDKKIVRLLTMGAYEEYQKSHFQVCEDLLNRILKTRSAVEQDYILLSLVNLAQYNKTEKYSQALNYLQRAKNLDVCYDYQVYKVEALVYLRQKNNPEALNSLRQYLVCLTDDISGIDSGLLVSSYWNNVYQRLSTEVDWTKKLIFSLEN